MSKIPVESLFFKGGTISENNITVTSFGNIAFNDNFVFLEKGNKIKVIKYEIKPSYTYRLLKTKLVISDIKNFVEWLLDADFMACLKEKIFNYYLNEI